MVFAIVLPLGAQGAGAPDHFQAKLDESGALVAPLNVPLAGTWGFSWGALLTPMQAHQAFHDGTLTNAPVPARWEDFMPREKNNLFLHGVATYVAQVDVPITDQDLVLALSAVLESYRVYWVPLDQPEDWELVAEEGAMEGPAMAAVRNQSHKFLGRGSGLLVIQVRKDVFGWSGINSWNGILNKPEITTLAANSKERLRHEMILGVVMGVILFNIAQNLLLFSLNRSNRAPLFLAVVSLMVAIRLFILWDKVELWINPEWFVLRMRIEMANLMVATSLLMGFNRALLPRFFPNWLMRLTLTVVTGLTCFIAAAPADIMSFALPVYQLVGMLVCLASLWGLIRAIIHREPGAILLGAALATLILGAIYDIISVVLRDYELFVLEYAFVLTMMAYTFLIAIRFADSQRQAASFLQERETLQRMHRAAVNSARHDHLTGLLNRQAFDHEFALAWEKLDTSGSSLSIVLFDIDHFKNFNDTQGHQVGDIVLQSLGKTLIDANMRKDDRICRYGGEEFAVILPNTSGKEACVIAERLRKEIAEMCITIEDGTALRITCSFGVAEVNSTATSVSALLRNADDALYEAKRSGRNRVRSLSGFKLQTTAA